MMSMLGITGQSKSSQIGFGFRSLTRRRAEGVAALRRGSATTAGSERRAKMIGGARFVIPENPKMFVQTILFTLFMCTR